MALTITAELLTELFERGSRHGETAIVLGEDGWDCLVHHGRRLPERLTGLTWEDAAGFTGGDELDEEATRALLAAVDYSIKDEEREPSLPGDDVEWAVITGAVDDVTATAEDLPWQEARWFDLGTTQRVLDQDDEALREERRAFSLWVTQRGQWLLATTSQYDSEPDQWVECTSQHAALLIYRADWSLLADEAELPLLARAARAARDLTDLLAFEVPDPEPDPERQAAACWKVRDVATEYEHATRVIGSLVRETVQQEIRTSRRNAARTVYRAHDGNATTAASSLGYSRRTLNDLLQAPDACLRAWSWSGRSGLWPGGGGGLVGKGAPAGGAPFPTSSRLHVGDVARHCRGSVKYPAGYFFSPGGMGMETVGVTVWIYAGSAARLDLLKKKQAAEQKATVRALVSEGASMKEARIAVSRMKPVEWRGWMRWWRGPCGGVWLSPTCRARGSRWGGRSVRGCRWRAGGRGLTWAPRSCSVTMGCRMTWWRSCVLLRGGSRRGRWASCGPGGWWARA
ncbi:hypothetical protein IHE61_31020 [Streptomyces sp. GKU 257-1]|nr:hypothetical protein [Streptomyces sp. GKU 257-1]